VIYAGYDQAELDRQYDQRNWAANAAEVIRRYTAESERVRQVLGGPKVMTYGPSSSETLDIYSALTPAAEAPVFVFIHGGAWRQLTKRDSAFAAETFVRNGVHFIALDFAPLPDVTLSQMVAQVRSGVSWIHANAAKFGGDPTQIHVCGHSSGGHLAGCVATTAWERHGLPWNAVRSVICASGMFDLRPVRLSARNAYVKLDDDSEYELGPIHHCDRIAAHLRVAYGSLESDEFKRQSTSFAQAAQLPTEAVLELEGLNHFEVVESLNDVKNGLGRVAFDLIGITSR
jgi:arylformamidase